MAFARGLFASIPLIVLGATVVAQGQAPAGAQTPPPKPAAAAPSAESVTRAEQILAASREALGGERLATLKTLSASGRTKRVRGNSLVPIEFEILVELPNKYVRIDESPAEDADPTSSGFNGEALIQLPPPPAMPPGRGGPPQMIPGTMPAPVATPMAPGTVPPRPADAPGPPAGASAPIPTAAPPSAMPPGTVPPPPPGTAPPPGGSGAPPPPVAGPAGAMPQGAMIPGATPMGGRGPAMDPRRARLTTVRQDFARLALGLFANSTAYPLTYAFAAVAEAPQGRADVLDVKGEGGLAMRYFINAETRLPIMVTWTTPPTNVLVTVPGQPPPATVAPGAVVVAGPAAPAAGAPKEEMDKYSKEVLAIRAKAQATPVENRLYFADYRDVEGLKLPFRLRRAIGAETTEETTFDRYRVNIKIDPKKFEPVK